MSLALSCQQVLASRARSTRLRATSTAAANGMLISSSQHTELAHDVQEFAPVCRIPQEKGAGSGMEASPGQTSIQECQRAITTHAHHLCRPSLVNQKQDKSRIALGHATGVIREPPWEYRGLKESAARAAARKTNEVESWKAMRVEGDYVCLEML